MDGLHALVVDDEQPVLDELVFLLGRDERIASVRAARSGTEALRVLEAGDVDLVFLDVVMPGLCGLEIGRVLSRFRTPPRIVFVTAHEAHAVDAFELGVVDYLLKPIREERLRESVRRAWRRGRLRPDTRGRVDRHRARRRHPVHPALRRGLRRGAGRLRPPAHRRRQPAT